MTIELLKKAKERKPTSGWDAKTDRRRAQAYLRSVTEDSVPAFPHDVIVQLRRYGLSPERCGAFIVKRWPEVYLEHSLAQEALREGILDHYIGAKDKPGKDACGDRFEGPIAEQRVVDYSETNLSASLDQIQKGLVQSTNAPIYKMGSRLVHPYRSSPILEDGDPIRRSNDSLLVGDVSALRLLEYVIDCVDLRKAKKVKQGNASKFQFERFVPPLKIASHLLARPDRWTYPELVGVIETPTLRKDGSLLVHEGYDSASGLLFDANGVIFPEIKNEPTRADAEAALEFLKIPFKDFPFVNDASRSVALSAALTILVRRTLRSAPAHGTTAPTMATGKTLLLNTVSMIATGREPSFMSQGKDGEEDEKRFLAALMKNDLMLVVDNITRDVEGDALCTILTEATWQCRRLGVNENVTVPTNCLIAMSGNNLTFKGDMTTRAILCRLDARVERPEERAFDIDLKKWVPEHRGELVAAGLTVLRAFVVAGRPGLDTFKSFGRFEDWSNLVRGALIWLGQADPCKTRESIIASDTDRDALGRLLDALCTTGEAMTAAGLVSADSDELRAAVDALGYEGNAKGLGHFLMVKHGQIIDGVRLEMTRDRKAKINVYRAININEPDFG
jgi:hypothetical protein